MQYIACLKAIGVFCLTECLGRQVLDGRSIMPTAALCETADKIKHIFVNSIKGI